MERMIMKAATTIATDQGVFEAVISTESIDREQDIVSADAMVAALHKWNRPIPLSWNHGLKAADIFGHVDPQSARNTGGEVTVQGQVDLASQMGGEAWRSFKNRTVGFSFGYLIPKGGSAKRAGGGRNITQLDIFEITATPAPMNNDTRVLSTKANGGGGQIRIVNSMIGQAQEFIAAETDEDDIQSMNDILDALQDFLGDEADEGETDDSDDSDDSDGGKALVPAGARWLFPKAELAAARAGEIKAVWTTAMVNDLPDSAFLYVAPGGDKDSEGKTTPRSLRYFPVKDASGAVDQAHVRNALARIPQSNLPQSVKDTATAKARRLLDSNKSVDATGKETARSRPVDPLRVKADALALEFASDGESLKKPPARKDAPKPEPQLSVDELRERTRALYLSVLSGVDDS